MLRKKENFTCSCNAVQVVSKEKYEKLLEALQDIANLRPHKQSALEMKDIAKKALSESAKQD